MVTISEGSAPLTVINVFTVSPENQPELVRLLSELTERTVQHLPGFVTTSIHTSLDGSRVVNYAQWESGEHLGALFTNPDAQEQMRSINDISTSEPNLYLVARVHESEAAQRGSAFVTAESG
jgi:quinol monooxygenase YgiN